jgi:hypothetical protein
MTVSDVDPLTEPVVALMVLLPGATPVARPFDPLALEIVAADVSDEAQLTNSVIG